MWATPALCAAVARTGPAAVVLWSQQAATAIPHQLAAVLADRARPLLLAAGGPGWDDVPLPLGVTHLTGLAEAVTLLAAPA